jgi:hypothetical protein
MARNPISLMPDYHGAASARARMLGIVIERTLKRLGPKSEYQSSLRRAALALRRIRRDEDKARSESRSRLARAELALEASEAVLKKVRRAGM